MKIIIITLMTLVLITLLFLILDIATMNSHPDHQAGAALSWMLSWPICYFMAFAIVKKCYGETVEL